MAELADPTTPRPDRRTFLTVSAWALPVVAAAVATPMAVASTAISDVALISGDGVTVIGATSPDDTQSYTLELPQTFNALTQSTDAVPPGASLVFSFDSRLIDVSSVQAGGTPAVLVSSANDGNVRTTTFRITTAIPSGSFLVIEPVLGVINNGTWVSDARPYSVTIVAPAGTSDPELGNNTVERSPNYVAGP